MATTFVDRACETKYGANERSLKKYRLGLRDAVYDSSRTNTQLNMIVSFPNGVNSGKPIETFETRAYTYHAQNETAILDLCAYIDRL